MTGPAKTSPAIMPGGESLLTTSFSTALRWILLCVSVRWPEPRLNSTLRSWNPHKGRRWVSLKMSMFLKCLLNSDTKRKKMQKKEKWGTKTKSFFLTFFFVNIGQHVCFVQEITTRILSDSRSIRDQYLYLHTTSKYDAGGVLWRYQLSTRLD